MKTRTTFRLRFARVDCHCVSVAESVARCGIHASLICAFVRVNLSLLKNSTKRKKGKLICVNHFVL